MKRAPYDAIILAGGRARRLDGASKPDVVLAGRRLLDHTLASTATAGRRVVVGPPALQVPAGVIRTQESPAHGGPAAGIDAGLHALQEHQRRAPLLHRLRPETPVLVLACDMPFVGSALPQLLANLGDAEAACLLDDEARPQWLAAVYLPSALRRALDALERTGGIRNAPVRRLADHLVLTAVPARDGTCADVDTWADHALLQSGSAPTTPLT